VNNLFIVITFILLSGCASFPQHNTPLVEFDNRINDKIKETAYFDVNITYQNDREILPLYGELQKRIQLKFDESNTFSDSYLSAENKGIHFRFTYSNYANMAKVISASVISGATLTLFPTFFTEHWLLNVKVYNGGELQYESEYTDELRTWLHLSMVFSPLFKPVMDEPFSLLANMAAQSIIDYQLYLDTKSDNKNVSLESTPSR